MKVLFVVGQFTVGGVETYVLRIAKALVADGVAVEIWVVKHSFDPALLAQLQATVRVRFLTPGWLPYPIFIGSPELPADVDMVFTTGRTALFCAARACALARRPMRLIAGVFSQWEYVINPRDPKSRLASDLVDQLGPANMVFCTEGSRADHVASLGDSYLASLVSPLLVDLPASAARTPRISGSPLRIVSVSRLVNFKTSNLQMAEVVARLNASGVPARWTLYGGGPEREKIEASVKAAGAEAFVSLQGPVPYTELSRVIGEADIYIGGGTTLIEASALGVPALVAQDSNPEPTSPGFLCDREGVFTSDVSDHDILVPIFDHIVRFAELDETGVKALSDRSRRKAELYGSPQARSEYEKMYQRGEPVRVTLPPGFQLRYFLGTFAEAARAVLGREAQPDRYGGLPQKPGPNAAAA